MFLQFKKLLNLEKAETTVANVYTRQTLAVDFRKLYFFTPSFLIVSF
jgi:hypothetical protein